MLNKDVLQNIEELNKLYEQRWHKTVDYTIMPKGLSQEQLHDILKYIVDTGDSILVGWNKLFRQ